MSDRSTELEGRVVKHLEEISEQRDSFDRVSAKLTEHGFVAAWGREGTADETDLKGSVERAYEQIVNDLQGMFDAIEVQASRSGTVPEPQLVAGSDDDKKAWWEAAEKLGFEVSASNRSQAPGRWRRLALYGLLDHALATSLIAWSDTRQLLQHAYAERTPERGREVWATMQALREQLDEVVAAIVSLQTRFART
jgi:hypothetical protein